MSDEESLRWDAEREREEEGCDAPYCANNPRSWGSYEAHAGALCGRCEEEAEQDERDRRAAREEEAEQDERDRRAAREEEEP